MIRPILALLALLALLAPSLAHAQSADARADALVAQMTPAEKRVLLRGYFAVDAHGKPAGAIGSAGYVPGVARLGIPALQETDASLGVTNPGDVRPGDTAVALPSGLALAAGFSADIAYANGALLGREAAARGLNVLLGPGLNLTRDPRGGRNFEYLGEDPLLAGMLAGAEARGIGDQHVIAVAKHFAANDQESSRALMNVGVDLGALAESDLLAFEIALEQGHPGAVMCAYNQVNGAPACGSRALLTLFLKQLWKFPGFVMSDWGAVHAATDLAAGLDQESAAEFDGQAFFGAPLDKALADGTVTQARVDDAARRIVRSMAAAGLLDHPPAPKPDVAGDIAVARAAEAAGIVLLRNEGGTLPLPAKLPCLLVTGSDSDAGVPAGGGSSQVTPVGPAARTIQLGGEGADSFFRRLLFDPPSPLARLQARLKGTKIFWVDGRYPHQAELLAEFCPAAIVFAQQWAGEASDIPDMSLPSGQNTLIEAVTRANKHTVVVLETAGPVEMPWLAQTGAVVEAWYGGSGGADAIVAALTGDADISGRLPMTFPARLADVPDIAISGQYVPPGTHVQVGFNEGAAAGYRWYAREGKTPLFPFGFGLSYTSFAYSNLKLTPGPRVRVAFDVRNTGARAGVDVPQVYLVGRNGGPGMRLLGWHRQALQSCEVAHVSLEVDPRLLADFVLLPPHWNVPRGSARIAVGANAADLKLQADVALPEGDLPP